MSLEQQRTLSSALIGFLTNRYVSAVAKPLMNRDISLSQTWQAGAAPLIAAPTLYLTTMSYAGGGWTSVSTAARLDLWYRILTVPEATFNQILLQNITTRNVPGNVVPDIHGTGS